MAEISINKNKVDAAVRIATVSVAQGVGGISPLEALIAFSQVVGRVIAAQQGTSLLHYDMVKLAMKTIDDTLKASYSAKGMNPEAIDEVVQ